MGKKQKRGSKQSIVPHREAFMRMNFLFQASLAVLSANPSHPQLSRFYVHTMKNVGKRLVLRMDPGMKRMLCKGCDSLLVPGVTATHRVRAHRETHVVVKCLTCGNVKRFPTRPDYQLWSDNPANVAQPQTTGEPPPTPATSGQTTATLDHSRAQTPTHPSTSKSPPTTTVDKNSATDP
ncbi:Ribonuclease P protein subunit p21 [Geodia barretti]|uniref:Ribonuclease P protein subunit p21 n=1 Tax=Geodia barretti TaxID=519541 RepID=A0AA35S737_GEOBA|nr:Ribonuclease P protein subunit p21 [Geodia barretti]